MAGPRSEPTSIPWSLAGVPFKGQSLFVSNLSGKFPTACFSAAPIVTRGPEPVMASQRSRERLGSNSNFFYYTFFHVDFISLDSDRC